MRWSMRVCDNRVLWSNGTRKRAEVIINCLCRNAMTVRIPMHALPVVGSVPSRLESRGEIHVLDTKLSTQLSNFNLIGYGVVQSLDLSSRWNEEHQQFSAPPFHLFFQFFENSRGHC